MHIVFDKFSQRYLSFAIQLSLAEEFNPFGLLSIFIQPLLSLQVSSVPFKKQVLEFILEIT